MSKLSFRARPLEASKPMPIYMSEELPDLPEYSAINRAVPQMPSGMKKEEECEHHLQRAIVTGQFIPTPEVIHIGDMVAYNRLYSPNYKVPRQLIHMQPFTMEQDIPDYDMDSEDEKWLAVHRKTLDIDELKFEEMMDRLEKNSGHSVVTQAEAKVLLKEDDDLIIAVYDYWLNKRLRTQQALIPCVKTEAHRGSNSNNNPYLAFRRRTEKMQTRKNRKNDESTYEKMVKLKRDLSRAVTLLELVKRRENSKRELLHLTVEVFEKRYQAQDYTGSLLAEVSAMKTVRPAFAPLYTNQYNHGTSWAKPVKDEYIPRKEKRQYKKRKHKNINSSLVMSEVTGVVSSGDDDGLNISPASPAHDDAPFAFRRKRQCLYHAPLTTGLGNWPWCNREDGGLADQRYRFSLTSITHPTNTSRCVGLARRRVGRGGRVILDRAGPPMDDFWASQDFTIHDNIKEKLPVSEERLTDEKPPMDDRSLLSDLFQDWPHFRPKSPLKTDPEEEEDVTDVLSGNSLSLAVEDLTEPSSDLLPVHLNLNELFPNLPLRESDDDDSEQQLSERTETTSSQTDNNSQTDTASSEPQTLSQDSGIEMATKNLKKACIDKKEYQSGSLLDRWARFESPPPEPVKKIKPPVVLEPFVGDKSGSSAFRTCNAWTDTRLGNLSEAKAVVTCRVSSQSVSVETVEEISHLPPTPPKEAQTPPPLACIHANGPINSELANNRHPSSRHYTPYRKKNNHNLHSHGMNNKLIMRIPENAGEMLETTVVTSQVMPDKNTNQVLMRKATQVPMEVT
ncbi:enhancer of polycomb homolog 1-like [Macrosteles quadrilineatus]|uniref:enhancer of polycomb homolog 1-like n=1 Tax=Macrosteles quadrilineatus TaxID=74068 RepID=UPI0023E1E0A6|nr:enhancer of polycomb homolog 1-like [Macrosteles quadrilineatus]